MLSLLVVLLGVALASGTDISLDDVNDLLVSQAAYCVKASRGP